MFVDNNNKSPPCFPLFSGATVNHNSITEPAPTMAESCNRAVVAEAVASSVAAASKAAADPSHAYIVPESMYLRESTREANFVKYPLIPLSIDMNENTVTESTPMASGEVIQKHTEEFGSICLVVRRPG